ncbi:hypothetical protein [Streptomyces turgidiscabies]|uniref:hypothetical protein n=1 Tax=Streptomyces turgidiscabies TaxID=85558 RepID=UPI0038F7954C
MTEPIPETPPVESTEPCAAVYPNDESITCELFLNHFDFRLPHTRHINGTIHEWE